MSIRRRFKTFATEQKTLLFFQIMILLGLLIQVAMFFAYLWYGRPPEGAYVVIAQFFLVAAIWVLTINTGIVLFWWVSRLGTWPVGETSSDDLSVEDP
ncbi:MAG: hypothetical protein R6V83_05335 [Candidatus Thorarchaeota archaeon]